MRGPECGRGSPQGEGLSEVKMTPLRVVTAVVIVAAGAVNILNGLGYENPQFMVLAAGLFAAAVIAVLALIRK